MKQIEEQKKAALEIIESIPLVFLSTIDEEGYPTTRIMMNLRHREYTYLTPLYEKEENPMTIYLTTHLSTKKIQEIIANNKSALYFYDHDTYKALLLQGKLELVEDKELKRKAWNNKWKEFFPKGVESDEYCLLRFIPV